MWTTMYTLKVYDNVEAQEIISEKNHFNFDDSKKFYTIIYNDGLNYINFSNFPKIYAGWLK